MTKYLCKFVPLLLILGGMLTFPVKQVKSQEKLGNQPARLEWLKDAGLGLFIHWGIDSQIGTVISHSLVGASEDYMKRFFNDLPQTFNPVRFDADEWARLARVCGFRYVVFTTKHHSGFCMFATKSNEFNIMHTPYGKDITAEVVQAFRNQGLAIGFYFSPDDFWVLHQQKLLISRRRPEALPENNPGLRQSNLKQIQELFTNYGPIDLLFIDGPSPESIRERAWELQPQVIVTRGALKTPEISPSTGQKLPPEIMTEPWEACFTLGTSWQFKPTHEHYRSGTEWIETLIETRAKGGTMLLNIGPEPNGELPKAQENILRELGAWMFINQEAIYGVRPWKVTHEKNIWYTRQKNAPTVYACITCEKWKWGSEKHLVLTAVKATPQTKVSVLGQNDQVLEYQPETIPQTRWEQKGAELHIWATRAQRIYNDRSWPNPVVLKITQVEE